MHFPTPNPVLTLTTLTLLLSRTSLVSATTTGGPPNPTESPSNAQVNL